MQTKGPHLGCRSDFNPEGLGLRSPTARDAPVVLRLHHLVLILNIGSQAVSRGFGMAPRTPRGVLPQLRGGLGGAVPGGGWGWRGAGDSDFGRGLAGCSWGRIGAVTCNPSAKMISPTCGEDAACRCPFATA